MCKTKHTNFIFRKIFHMFQNQTTMQIMYLVQKIFTIYKTFKFSLYPQFVNIPLKVYNFLNNICIDNYDIKNIKIFLTTIIVYIS